jgi:hypothetical protein
MGFASPAGELNGGLVRPAPEVTMTQSHWLQSAIDLQRTVAVQFTTVSNAAISVIGDDASIGFERPVSGGRPVTHATYLLSWNLLLVTSNTSVESGPRIT